MFFRRPFTLELHDFNESEPIFTRICIYVSKQIDIMTFDLRDKGGQITETILTYNLHVWKLDLSVILSQ